MKYQCAYQYWNVLSMWLWKGNIMENKLRVAEQIASERTMKNISAIKEKVGSYDVKQQDAYLLGYVDRDIKELMKDDGVLSESISKIVKHTQTDEETNEAMDALIDLIYIVYKAGFECGSDLS